MIRRSYSPPFQARAPRPGADDLGRTVKGLVSVELARSTEISFALESFGCDGKPVLSLLRGLPCEATGKLTVAGTKNGMPFSLNSDLPRGLGSAIRGSGGTLRQIGSSAAFKTLEWVLYDNFGNHWSLDVLTGGKPTYLGETPPLAAGDGVTPAVCTQSPWIRPYELRWEYIGEGGDPVVIQPMYLVAGAGWISDDSNSPVIVYPVDFPYSPPSEYYRIEQWIPDEVSPPPGGSFAAAWPGSKRHVDVEWYPARIDTPHDWDSQTENSVDVIVSKYPTEPPWRIYMNRLTRPLIEHISTGGSAEEMGLVICVEKKVLSSPYPSRIVLRGRNTGELKGSPIAYTARSDSRHMFTPYKGEGWILQTGAVTSSTVTLRKFQSRATSTDDFGSALTWMGNFNVTLPAGAAHSWDSEPVWLRVGQVSRYFGSNPFLWPRLPRWR